MRKQLARPPPCVETVASGANCLKSSTSRNDLSDLGSNPAELVRQYSCPTRPQFGVRAPLLLSYSQRPKDTKQGTRHETFTGLSE